MATGSEPLVVWINGAFGVGKTTVAGELVRMLPGAILFDPEELGVVLRAAVPAAEQTDDFQDIHAWRATTLAAVVSLARSREGAVVVPVTLVDEGYFDAIVGGVRRSGVGVVHVALVAPSEVIEARLLGRTGPEWDGEQPIGEHWGIVRIERCVTALADERFGEHIDATSATPDELARRICALIERRAGAAA